MAPPIGAQLLTSLREYPANLYLRGIKVQMLGTRRFQEGTLPLLVLDLARGAQRG
jgi:hypothetical protein